MNQRLFVVVLKQLIIAIATVISMMISSKCQQDNSFQASSHNNEDNCLAVEG